MELNQRLKVLVVAYACSPFRGSEPGVGWGFVSALARCHDLWVIVEEEKFREDIERNLMADPQLGRSVRFFFVRKQRNRLLRKFWPPSYYWYYRRWHEDAYHLAQELHREVGFDLVHQLTMVGFREPGYMSKLGIPFVWGPVGGMGLFPWKFMHVVGWYGSIYCVGYNLYNWFQMKNLSRPREAARVAGIGLITATPENRDGALKYWGCRSSVICEVGLPREPVINIPERTKGEPFRLVWVGQHIPRKALNLGLGALGRLPDDVDWEIHILGAGPRMVHWQRLANRLGIASRCLFHGKVTRDKVLDIMGTAHTMLITSLRDLTSTVTVEALAMGLPIICLDHCGFADVVDESCGIKIPVTTPNRTIDAMAQAIERLARDEQRRRELARGALRRSLDFSWEEKAICLDRIYRAKVAGCNSPGDVPIRYESLSR
ncbi:MAG: glycosyltransferase [Deltaproteobacteria bacterium]|nr:glycosyltransferase [Deltaproteobacteria bacterium]